MRRYHMPWTKEERSDIIAKVILFFISPFFAALYSIRRMNTRSSYIMFFLFAVFFGMAFSVPSGKTNDFMLDGAFYRNEFDRFLKGGEALFLLKWVRFINFEVGNKDIWFDSVVYSITRFSDNYHIMFLIFAVIFAFFALKSLRFLTSEQAYNFSAQTLLLVFLFMINQIFNINGVRFWTAAWVAVYSIFQIYKNGNKKFILLALVTPLIHGSYWIFLGILLIAFLLMNFRKTCIFLFFISFVISGFAVGVIQSNIDLLPEAFSKSAEAYSSTKYIKSQSEGSGFYWVSVLFSNLQYLYINIMVVLLIFNWKKMIFDVRTKNLFVFLLIWMSFSNFSMPVPSFGVRFIVLAYPLIAYLWLIHFKGKKYQEFLFFLPVVFLMWFYDFIRQIFATIDVGFYFSSPFYLIYKYIIS